MLSVYFDASLLVSMFVHDPLSARADAYIASANPTATVSDFASAEFASALGVKLRRGELDTTKVRAVLADFDGWRSRGTVGCELTNADVVTADAILRRFDLPLRAPDAMHLAIAQRLGVPIATFDVQMALSAGALGVTLAPT